MEGDYGSNLHTGLEKYVRFIECPLRVSAWERFCYKGFLRNSSMTTFFVRLREVFALEDVHFREVPLYVQLKVPLYTTCSTLGSIERIVIRIWNI